VIATEAYAIPIFHNVSPLELSMLGCSGACGLGTTLGVAPVTVGADVVVLGCGPLGLSAVQGARIKGASQIIAVEPIPARRAVAQQLGATTVIDPNVDTANVVAKIRDLCKGPSDRLFAGGRTGAQAGTRLRDRGRRRRLAAGETARPRSHRRAPAAVGVDLVFARRSRHHRSPSDRRGTSPCLPASGRMERRTTIPATSTG
jgi:threonine dehydrogenase-like Zn-dependent dehydrogenase